MEIPGDDDDRDNERSLVVLRGRFVHSVVLGTIETHHDALLAFDRSTGRIVRFEPRASDVDDNDELLRRSTQIPSRCFVTPGFVDAHVHAPQYAYAGTATDRPLMEWLDEYTFPVERSFEDLAVAERYYSAVIRRTLREGTTTAAYYLTAHLPASKLFADLLDRHGQRGLVGMVQMDRHSPPDYVRTTEQCLRDAEELVDHLEAKRRSNDACLALPVLTPRFVPTCSPALLAGLGRLAATRDVRVQTHAAESDDEIAFVESLHPGQRDCELLDRAGLLTSRTVLAHGVHLTDDETDSLRRRGVAVAHCPLSNAFFADGILPCADLLRRGVRVGLGTDVAGGYDPSVLSAARAAVVAHRTRRATTRDENDVDVDFRAAFWMATAGGARALFMEDELGTFTTGKYFDALLIDPGVENSRVEVFEERDTFEDVFQKFVNLGDDRNIVKVWVRGRDVTVTTTTSTEKKR